MKITASHYKFWVAKKTIKPVFARDLKLAPCPSIHALINIANGEWSHSEPHNTLVILRSAQRKGKLIEALEKLACQESIIDKSTRHSRRIMSCRKWLARIVKEEA